VGDRGAELLWTPLLVVLVAFLVDDHPLRALSAVHLDPARHRSI